MTLSPDAKAERDAIVAFLRAEAADRIGHDERGAHVRAYVARQIAAGLHLSGDRCDTCGAASIHMSETPCGSLECATCADRRNEDAYERQLCANLASGGVDPQAALIRAHDEHMALKGRK